MSWRSYLKSSLGEFVLVLVSACALAYVGFNAFFVDEGLRQGPLPVAGVLVLLLALYAAAYQRTWLVRGAVACALVVAAYVAAALATSSAATPYLDVEGSNLFFALVIVFSALACFLLTRTLPGSVAWFVVSSFACSVVQAFYESGELVCSVLVLVSSLALVVHRNFRLGTLRADTARRAPGGGALAASVLPVVLASGVGLLLWALVIAPLNPAVLHITLVTEHRQLPVVELRGTAEIDPVFNTDLTTDRLTEGERYTTDDLKTGEGEVEVAAQAQPEGQRDQDAQGGGSAAGTRDQLDPSSSEQQFDTRAYSLDVPVALLVIIALLLVAAAVAALVVLRRKRRVARLVAMLEQPPRQQVVSLYTFLLGKLKVLGFAVPAGMTLAEWSFNQERRMDALTLETKVPFSQLTTLYEAVVYGNHEPSEEEIVLFVAYYRGFWKAARAYLGNARYFLHTLRLGR